MQVHGIDKSTKTDANTASLCAFAHGVKASNKYKRIYYKPGGRQTE